MQRFLFCFLLALFFAVPAPGNTQAVTQTFPETGAVLESGYFTTLPVGDPPRPARQFTSNGSQMDFVVNGTDCSLNCRATSLNSIEASIDGGVPIVTGPTTMDTWTSIPLFSGLPDSPHTVRLKQTGSLGCFYIDSDNMLTVQGSAPSVASIASVDPANWGNQQYIISNYGNPLPYLLTEAQTFGTRVTDGYAPGVLYNYSLSINYTYYDGSIRFRAQGSAVRAWMALLGSIWQVTVDGVNQPLVTAPTSPNAPDHIYDWVTLASGLDPAVEHEFIVTNVSQGGDPSRVFALMFPHGSLNTSVILAPRRLFMATGHSIVAGAKLPDLTSVYYQAMAQKHNYAIADRGIGGSTFKNYPDNANPRYSTRSGEARITEVLALQPDICVIDDFTNDQGNGSGASPPESPADLQAVLTPYLETVLSQCPNTHFYVLGILPKGPLDMTLWNAAIQAAVQAQNSPRCLYVDQTGWIDPTIDTFDGTHPTIEGHQKIASHLEPIIFPPPVASDQTLSTPEETALAITLSATQTNGDGLSYSVLTPPQSGTLTGEAPNLTYTPAAGYNGSDSFTFQALDNYGVFSNPATVTIQVTAVNDPPVADDQAVTTLEDTALPVTLTASDADGDTLAYTLTAPPAHGTLTGEAPNLTYTPDADYNGSDSFTFQVNDGQADSNAATVAIVVTPVNDLPLAVNDAATTKKNTAVTIPVLANDSDVDGDTLTVESVTRSARGSVVKNADGTMTYRPRRGFTGRTGFTYTISDGHGGTAAATVTIIVK